MRVTMLVRSMTRLGNLVRGWSGRKEGRSVNRYQTTVARPVNADRVRNVNNVEWEAARPFEKIPGPKPLPLIGNIFRYLPYIGEFGNIPMPKQIEMLHAQYGNIVKLEGLLARRTCVFLFDAELCEKMYRTEGPWPMRISLESMRRYREERADIYQGQLGLALSQGEEWYKFRTKVNQHMMQPQATKAHVEPIDEVANDFIVRMRQLRGTETLELPSNFNNELNKWALESICAIALDHRLGCLESNLPSDSEPQKMINAVHDMFSLLYTLELLPSLWKIYDTSDLKRLYQTLDIIVEISDKYIDQARERLHDFPTSENREPSVLEKLLNKDQQTARVMALDMMIAGIDTTSNTTGISLYHIATDSRVQKKLHEEAKKALPSKSSPVTFNTFNEIPYLKACIKEALRVSPIIIGNMRTMQKDIAIGGYQIPKGTDVVATHSIISLDHKHFPKAEMFIPERWMTNNTEVSSAKEAHPFAYMPFGFGPRTCIGRRFAQLEMETLLVKILRNFHIEWHHEPIQFKSNFLQTIESPLRFKLIDL